tara:strand:+ start:8315 stop:8992 length:678 start_codon:yes stop_codon:yes gene_type:complete
LRGLKNISKRTDGWKIKKVLKPLYLPVLHKLQYFFANRNFKKEGDNVLKTATLAFDEIGLFFWLEFGTLLGVVRDGKLIEHDTDIDVGVMLTDYSPEIEKALVKHGFVKTRKFEIDGGAYGIEESYELNGVSFDLFYFTKRDDEMYCHLFPEEVKGDYLVRELYTKAVDFKSIDWQGNKVNIPKDSDQRLRDTYGDYTIKIKDWYTPDAALNSKIIDKKVKMINY